SLMKFLRVLNGANKVKSMKSVLCFICVGLSLCYTVCSQSLSPQEWEEICDHQGADWTNSFQEFDIRNIRLLSTEQLSTAWERRYESIEEWNEEQRMYEDFLVYNPDCS